jgi:hypothetical protein
MSTPAPPDDSPSLEDRVSSLEAENRELYWRVNQLRFLAAMLGVGVLLYAGLHAFYGLPVKASVVEARQVIVRDAAGRVRLVLACNEQLPDAFRSKDNPGLLLYDEKGAVRGHLYASEELSGLGLFDPDGKPREALTHRNGWSGVWLKDRGGVIRVGMALDAGGPRLVVQDEQERVLFGQP